MASATSYKNLKGKKVGVQLDQADLYDQIGALKDEKITLKEQMQVNDTSGLEGQVAAQQKYIEMI